MASPAAGAAASEMDAIYRHQRFIYDLTRRYYLFGRDEMLARLNPPRGGTVIEAGCGTARNLLAAAKLYPEARFYGFDVSHEMLKTAAQSVGRSTCKDRIQLAAADATTFDASTLFAIPGADRVFISYALSMIPVWEQVIDRALDQLAPGGELHIVDFGRMQQMPRFGRKLLLAWLSKFSVTPRSDLEAVIRSKAHARGLQVRFHEGRAGYAAHAIVGA